MQKWQDIEENDILDWNEAHTGKIAQYDRIMSRKLRDSIISLTNSFEKQSRELIDSINTFNDTSTKLSSRLYWLNFFLVVLTIILVIFGFPAFMQYIKSIFSH